MKPETLTAKLLLVLIVAQFAGCNNKPPKPQAVVINIGAIAEVVGVEAQVKKRMQATDQQIAEEIKAVSDKLRKAVDGENESSGGSPFEEGEKRILALQSQLKEQVTRIRKEGNTRRMKEASEIRRSFLDGLLPIAQKIALERGASIILKGRVVSWSDESVDITNAVIGRMTDGKDIQSAVRERN